MATTPTYTRQNLQDAIADTIRMKNISSSLVVQTVLNRVARIVTDETDLVSAKRKAQLTPKIFDDIYDYALPTDYEAFIDIQPQANRSQRQRWFLVEEEYFDAKKSGYTNIVAVADDDLTRILRLNIDAKDTSLTVGNLDTLTGDGGTWILFGDATNVVANDDNYIKGGGSINYDLVGSGTTAGISNVGLTAFDITDYINTGSAFAWAYINQTSLITNFILRLGNDITANYYQLSTTTQNDGSAFVVGWNLLRFDFSGVSATGTVVPTTCDSCALYMTKTSGKSDDGYLFDDITLHTGEYMNLLYYGKYPWQSSTGTYLENSTASTDYINANKEEFELFVHKGKEEFAKELVDWDRMKIAQADYQMAKERYTEKHPSERKQIINFY